MKVIAYSTGSGVSIVHPTGEIPIKDVLAKDVPEEFRDTAKIIERSSLPDYAARDQWILKDGKVVVGL